MLTEIIAILFLFILSWMFIMAAHIAILKNKDDKDMPTACVSFVALIITLAAVLIL